MYGPSWHSISPAKLGDQVSQSMVRSESLSLANPGDMSLVSVDLSQLVGEVILAPQISATL